VAQNIGTDYVHVDANHPSIKTIVQYKSSDFNFDFKPVSENFISKQIDKLKIKKATGRQYPSKGSQTWQARSRKTIN